MRDSIVELYRVFEPYQLGEDFCGISFGVSNNDYHALTDKPLAELTTGDLDRYVSHAMTTWGNLGHFKHFLPRLMELACGEFLTFEEPEVLFGKLELARWQSWPSEESEAVRAALMTFWLRQLATPGPFPNDTRIETALRGLAKASDSLQPYLDRWVAIGDATAALHLCQIVQLYADERNVSVSRRRLGCAVAAPSEVLVRWLPSRAVNDFLAMHLSEIEQPFSPLAERIGASQTHRTDGGDSHRYAHRDRMGPADGNRKSPQRRGEKQGRSSA